MTITTGNRAPMPSATHDFDGLVSPTRPTSGSEVAETEYAASAHPTTRTVVGAFLAIAIAQVVVVAIALSIFDLVGARLMLFGVVVAPAVLYALIAAWDHRELTASGHIDAPRWVWALVPPLYLAMRRRTPARSGPAHVALGWSIAQAALTVAFVLFAAALVVTGPAPSAGAMPGASAPTTPQQVAEVVERRWADAGASGQADCAGADRLAPGSRVECSADLEGARLVFTASIGDAVGDDAVVVTSWAEVPGR